MPPKRPSDSDEDTSSTGEDESTSTGSEETTSEEGSEQDTRKPAAKPAPKKEVTRDPSTPPPQSPPAKEVAPAKSAAPAAAPAPAPAPAPVAAKGAAVVISNKPHDEEFSVEDDKHCTTPPQGKPRPGPAAAPSGTSNAAPTGGPTQKLSNLPNDESFTVEDDRHISTPKQNAAKPAPSSTSGGAPTTVVKPLGPVAGPKGKPSSGLIPNDHADEYVDADDTGHIVTPKKGPPKPDGAQAGTRDEKALRNLPNDVEIEADGQEEDSPPQQKKDNFNERVSGKPNASSPPKTLGSMVAPREESDASEEESAEDKNKTSTEASPGSVPAISSESVAVPVNNDYNPDDYAFINSKVSHEVRDLFAFITAYQPVNIDLPAKFRPFIPDYIPCVGDMDTFCKVPRPDGRPDFMGLHVVDEPSSSQSNPAVVILGLQYTQKQPSAATFIDSVDDAVNRPGVVDKWIADIKQLHAKKPMPTVSYSKPMPEIDSLLQVWPSEFEEMLNSDILLPPSNIDLDIYQYVRMICAITDVPTYTNLIESLHVLFTLYLEFRANQHFQHA